MKCLEIDIKIVSKFPIHCGNIQQNIMFQENIKHITHLTINPVQNVSKDSTF